MKHIIIEGPDKSGKNSLIKSLLDYYDFDNVSVRHFGKPPSYLSNLQEIIDFQFTAFGKELNILHNLDEIENSGYNYYPNVVLWNRSHIGEYVYGSMFRKAKKDYLLNLIKSFEHFLFDNTYLISLTGDPEFLLSIEDGKSFSQTISQKKEEIETFKEIFSLTSIKKKKEIFINDENLKFKPKKDNLNEVLEFIKK